MKEVGETYRARSLTDGRQNSDRVVLQGVIRKEPVFRRTRHGHLLGKLRLSERIADGKTVWHSVWAFKQKAIQWQQQHLRKGDRIVVKGYHQDRYFVDRDGKRQ